ncbi:hypothetical protein, partial [Helicobacter suis]|uniref:hypothetical protein n=1 Tax=Helicobacter suis TaxID=104628 RepID=UPI0009BCFBDC
DTSYRRYECMGALYHKLVAFIPPAKDEWDFCRRVLNYIPMFGVYSHLINSPTQASICVIL